MVKLPDGTQVNRVHGFRLWMWDTEFCGSIGLRWQPGTTELPPHCLGHIGLSFVELTTDPENVASQRVIVANGGVLFDEFVMPLQHGNRPGLRYRVYRPEHQVSRD